MFFFLYLCVSVHSECTTSDEYFMIQLINFLFKFKHFAEQNTNKINNKKLTLKFIPIIELLKVSHPI